MLLPLQGALQFLVLFPRAMPWAMCFCPVGACWIFQIESSFSINFTFDTPSCWMFQFESSFSINFTFDFSLIDIANIVFRTSKKLQRKFSF